MRHRLLIAVTDLVARVSLRGEFVRAGYDVTVVSSLDQIGRDVERPHAVILGAPFDPDATMCHLDRHFGRDSAAPRVIGFGRSDPEARLAAIRAGFSDIVIDLRLLRARLRDVLRAEEAILEAERRRSASAMLGMAEPKAIFAPLTQIRLVGDIPVSIEAAAAARPGWRVRHCRPDRLLSDPSGAEAYLLAAGAGIDVLLPELRARATSRHAVILVLYDATNPFEAAYALDARASDVAPVCATGEEVALRLERALLRKASDDILRRQTDETFELASRDPLTGLYNRRYAEAYLAQTLKNAETSPDLYAAMVIDLDHLKAINDGHGHPTGDAVIRAVATLMREELRSTDLVARTGGDEFLVVMPRTTPEEAGGAAERLRRRVAALRIEAGPNVIRPTLSIGIVMRPRRQDGIRTADTLLAAADAALYLAKSAGRNCVRLNPEYA